ncbi:uncharacterized protein ACN427_013771 isoform 2-T2 [Glossina fuscipes fuscipes]
MVTDHSNIPKASLMRENNFLSYHNFTAPSNGFLGTIPVNGTSKSFCFIYVDKFNLKDNTNSGRRLIGPRDNVGHPEQFLSAEF